MFAIKILGLQSKVNHFRHIGNNFLRTMSENGSPNDDFASQKEYYLNLSVDEKRKHYKRPIFTLLDSVKTWKEYVMEKENSGEKLSCVNDELNSKVSLWQGDITSLEIDAIVNAANSALKRGGGVDGAIHNAAGAYLQDECDTLGGCPTGEAKLCGGYKLPAKYLIQTVGPRGEKPDKLQACYLNSLDIASRNNIRTLAFPCISTGIYGYPPENASDVAVSTVRKYLEDNSDKFDRVIFCVFLDTDKIIYEETLPKYFPLN